MSANLAPAPPLPPAQHAPAKLLLFGEHTVLHGSTAYALPLPLFSAELDLAGGAESAGQPFTGWLAYVAQRPALAAALELERWRAEAPRLRLVSDIPQGYGLGSSGALTALVYRRYGRPAAGRYREVLAGLEGYFHGRSSGLDPLVSYLGAPVVVERDGSVSLPEEASPTPPALHPGGRWFLLDSGRQRAGGEAVARFGESCRDETWARTVLRPMIGLVDDLVEGVARGLAGGLAPKLRALSAHQLEHLGFLIPRNVAAHWRRGLGDDTFWCKLCGAGGGGYFLGYAPEPTAVDAAGAELLWLGSPTSAS